MVLFYLFYKVLCGFESPTVKISHFLEFTNSGTKKSFKINIGSLGAKITVPEKMA